MHERARSAAAARLFAILLFATTSVHAQSSRYATSDNKSGYVHWIDLYDASNTRIDPLAENPKPYSPEKTCGRCHEFDTISHGWHFNAVSSEANGRPGQPWIWSDERTGTHLPLSYRDWEGTFNPDELGLSRWQVAAKLGGFLPGGGPGSSQSLASGKDSEASDTEEYVDRTNVTGPLPVDCLMCHRNQGSGYSPFVWTEQIEDENFAYAPTAALGLATVSGSMKRLKDDFDPTSDDAASRLPKVVYEKNRFRSDGKVFVDLVRKPKNNSCYYCHTNTTSDALTGSRWLHDEDVHIRAGIACADCHRNALDHNTVRGFEGEVHTAGTSVGALSCQGCHMPGAAGSPPAGSELAMPGRFGAPQPGHKGLPPLHFEKLSCTACHSGGLLQPVATREINSIAHRLGEHGIKRTGLEQPGIVGPVHLTSSVDVAGSSGHGSDTEEAGDGNAELVLANEVGGEHATTISKYTPHRMMWPSYWGTIADGKISVLNPEAVYDLVRRSLGVRRGSNFTEGLGEVKLSLPVRKELLGDERARAKPEEWTEEEKKKVEEAETAARIEQVGERMAESLAAIEKEYADTQAVFVSGGMGFVRDGEASIKTLPSEQLGKSADPYAWPVAHNVRPARQSLGVNGCTECHSDNSLFFNAEVLPVGLLPDQETVAMKTHQLQGVDTTRLKTWNRLFQGRAFFKIAGLIALGLTCLVAISAVAINLNGFWRR